MFIALPPELSLRKFLTFLQQLKGILEYAQAIGDNFVLCSEYFI